MATNIRRSLFIGIGGTGINAILNTKKMFLDTYGEVPPMVGFLGIDTDKGEFEKQRVMTRNGKRAMLTSRCRSACSTRSHCLRETRTT